MGMFNRYPYGDLEDYNLDFLLSHLKKVEEILEHSERVLVGTRYNGTYNADTETLSIELTPIEEV